MNPGIEKANNIFLFAYLEFFVVFWQGLLHHLLNRMVIFNKRNGKWKTDGKKKNWNLLSMKKNKNLSFKKKKKFGFVFGHFWKTQMLC